MDDIKTTKRVRIKGI
uniref:Uncharacterized protein n=1 Tax=Arundo donax TaxID=35708 RepID=A0A0A8YIM5_ARUDO